MTDENADLIEFASPPPKTLSSQQQPQQNGLSKTVRKSLQSPPTNLLDITLSTENGSSNDSNSTQQQIVDVDDEKTMKTKMSNEENSVKSPPPAIILRPASFDPSNENGTIVNNENNSNTGGDQTADLDIVDFDNDLINVDQDFWLCDPKTASLDTNTVSTTTTQLGNKISSSNSNNKPPHDRNRAGGVKSITTTVQQESDDQTTPQQLNPNEKEQLNGGANRGRSKNLVKWITEDFQEDKNLDKVKRTLLVTLDDISKGYNRRSRSVSTTRTPYYGNSNGMGAQNAALMQPPPLPPSSNHYHHQYHNYNQHQYHAPSHPHPHHHQLHHQSSTNDINHHGGSRSSLHPAKSIESILNESNADVIDSNSNHHTSDIMSNRSMLGFGSAAATNSDEGIVRSGSNSTANKPTSYSSATIVKRRHDARSNGLGIGDVNSMMMTHNVENSEQENNIDTSNILPLEQTQYNDILDVQVIARMQEEALALSMMKPNSKTTRGDEVDLPPQDVLKRGTYSTATITKRVNSRSYAPANNNFYQQAGYEYENNSSNRRDSASSSDQSSMSSSASNYELPYGNNLNAETQHPQFSSMTITKKQSPRKALQTTTRAMEANVTPAVTPSTTAGRRSTNMSSNYKNLVKSNVNIHGIGAQRNQMMSIASSTSKVSGSGSSRSSTPSKSNVAAINSQSAPNKNDSRLPTPRTNNRLQSASTTQYQQMEMPQRSLQVAKPPIAPHHQQTPSTTGVTTAAAGGALRAVAGKSGRTPMAYGGQRSATTSIMTTATTPVVQQQQPAQPKMTTLQKQFNAKQQQQMPNNFNGATNGGSRNMVPRTSTSQSIASSNSSSTIASSYSSSSASSSSSANQTSIYSTTSPSSISSSSSTCSTTSSSKQLPKSTNRSESPGQSNNFIAPQQQPQQQNQQPFYINGGPTSIISPSGLLTDGPLGRRPTTTRVSAASPHRDRSVSPATGNRSSNSGSNSNLTTIQETKIPGKIATSATSRKSFLPQPVSYAQQQPIQYSTRHRESSNSPVRMSTNEISNDNMLANWKDGCF